MQFHEKKACFVVLDQPFIKLLTFQPGDFNSDLLTVLVDGKNLLPRRML